MIGEPFDLKPSTSSLDRPPLQTVAPNVSTSGELFGRRKWMTLMPHDGTGTRSGGTRPTGYSGSEHWLAAEAGRRARPGGGWPALPRRGTGIRSA